MTGKWIKPSVNFSLILVLWLGACGPGPAAEPITIPLWPDGVPGAKGIGSEETYSEGRISHVHEPTIAVHLPPEDKSTGTAVVIAPGGGYGILAIDKEGHDVARWLNSLGVAGIVLKYRLGDYGHPAPLQDAQRALSTVRSRAAEWNIDPRRIGIMGFSAGGHLASTAGTHFHSGDSGAENPIDWAGNRPDFMILIYPVISMQEGLTHQGSRKNLMGEDPDKQLVEYLSNELQVTPETPPTFLVHADDDKAVLAENSVSFYLALRKAGVPAEMHIYEEGGHGFGLGVRGGSVTSWPGRCADWLAGRDLLNVEE